MKIAKDLTGQRFGRLTALEYEHKHNTGKPNSVWLCKCDCGKQTRVSSKDLTRGRSKSCGCKGTRKHKFKSGERFGLLTVKRSLLKHESPLGFACYECKCDCGNVKLVRPGNLANGSTQSCGTCVKRGRKRKHVLETDTAFTDYSLNARYLSYLSSAKKRNLKFELSFEQFAKLVKTNCHYCSYKVKLNGIDRKDNALGYIEGNVLPCCKTCNVAKGTMSYEEFIKWVMRLHRNLITKVLLK